MSVSFEVSGEIYTLPAAQATILAEKLRVFATGGYRDDVQLLADLGTEEAWIDGARAVADFMEDVIRGDITAPLPLEGKAADAVYQVLRLTQDPAGTLIPSASVALRDALRELLELRG